MRIIGGTKLLGEDVLWEVNKNFTGGVGNMANLEIFDGVWRRPFFTTWHPLNYFKCTYTHVPYPGPIHWRLRHAEPGHVNKPYEFYWPQNGTI